MIFGKDKNLDSFACSDINTVGETNKKSYTKRGSRSLLRQLSQLSRRSIDSISSSWSLSSATSTSPRTPSPRSTICELPISCELTLLSALQGVSISSDDMRNCANEISHLQNHEKQKLIQFFKNEGEAGGIIENNAYKAFVCSNLTTECLYENVDTLLDLWHTLRQEIIPTMQAMSYPLVEFDDTFDVQKLIITAFRDRVLAKLLQSIDTEIPQLHSMLFAVLLETDDPNPELSHKIDVCTGNHKNMKNRYIKNSRSKTEPCVQNKRKSVTWVDTRKTTSTVS